MSIYDYFEGNLFFTLNLLDMRTSNYSLAAVVMCLLMAFGHAGAQNLYPNQTCTDGENCKSGICLRLRNGDMVCGTCSQSTFDNLAPKVDQYCKAYGDGWAPEKAPEYNSMEVEGRVQVEVYDEMLEKAKACKEAREDLQEECFEGGESYDKYDHAKQLRNIEGSISRIAEHKKTMIDAKRVYYCSKSTYEGALRQYDSKCGSLDFNQVKQKLDSKKYDLSKGLKVDCDLLEDLAEDCKECAYAAQQLIDYGFKGSSSYTPTEYSTKLEKAEEMQELLEEQHELAEDKDLCD